MKLVFLLFLIACSSSDKNTVTQIQTESIQKSLKSSKEDLRNCIESDFYVKNTCKVFFDFIIDKMGRAKDVEIMPIEEPCLSESSKKCIATKIENIQFVTPANGFDKITVKQPFHFHN